MRYILFLPLMLYACSTTQKLPPGLWSGYLSPMDQPDKRLTLKYEVEHQQELISLQIFGPRGMNIRTKDLEMTKDSLYFSFDKIDQSGILSCALKKVNKNYYFGKCTDEEDRWAVVTMKHNSLDFSRVGHQFGGCPCHS